MASVGSTEDEFGALSRKAMKQLGEFFNEGEHTSKSIAAARVATAILSSWTRDHQTRSAEKATMFMVARELASDKNQLAEYIRITMPDLELVKALPEA